MPTIAELERQNAYLENELRTRDQAEAKAKADALAAANVVSDAKATAARAEAQAAEREKIRRGAHLSALLAKLDPKQPVDFAALERQIPPTGFPPGFDESALHLLGIPKPADLPEVNTTSMGKLMGGTHG